MFKDNKLDTEQISDIKSVIDDIKNFAKPSEIILFHKKVSNVGTTIGFKVCLVMDVDDKLEIEKNIYKHVDSDVPFDVIIYTCDEWNKLKSEKHSFANNILKRGYFF